MKKCFSHCTTCRSNLEVRNRFICSMDRLLVIFWLTLSICYFVHPFFPHTCILVLQLTAKRLVDPQGESPKRFSFFKHSGQEEAQDVKTDCEFPISLFSPTLETLLLNDNNLLMVPLSLCGLMSLVELDLSK